MRAQTMVQLSEALVLELDERAARDGVSRSHLIREAVRAYLAGDEERARIERFVAGYRRCPETEEELATAHANARALVAAEPW